MRKMEEVRYASHALRQRESAARESAARRCKCEEQQAPGEADGNDEARHTVREETI